VDRVGRGYDHFDWKSMGGADRDAEDAISSEMDIPSGSVGGDGFLALISDVDGVERRSFCC